MTRPPKPSALAPILENIPAQLKAIPRWICWKIAWSDKRQKWIKLPLDARARRAAKSSDPATWTDYETAAAAFKKGCGDGLGFVFNGDGITGLDFDDCFSLTDGTIEGPVLDVLDGAGYWELSPSGNGLHWFTRAAPSKSYKSDTKHIEIYPDERFFTLTGHVFNGQAGPLPDTPVDLSQFIEKHFSTDKPKAPVQLPAPTENNFFRRVNDAALQNLGAWIPVLFPEAAESNHGYRVASASLGRDLEEDISATPDGIKDFGVHDMGDEREGKRTPIDLVQEWYAQQLAGGDELATPSVVAAAKWLCEQMHVEPTELGWQPPARAADPQNAKLDLDTDEDGQPFATIGNVLAALRAPDYIGARIGLDSFRDEIMITASAEEAWRPFTDADYTRLRWVLELKGFKAVGRELMRDAVALVAEEYKFDSAITWLTALQWDNQPRIERFLVDYLGAKDTPYTRAVSRYLWTALAGRVLQPGCKADMALILIGAQGIGKSSAVAALVPSPDHFCEISLIDRDDDLARKMRGRLVGEIGELRGLNSRDLNEIKNFISRTYEDWTPKYREFNVKYPRRLVFIGTTNQDEFLADETGNRRWLPVRLTAALLERIRADLLQLWAEAAALFTASGLQYAEAEKLALEVHQDHMISDAWEGPILEWLNTPSEEDIAGVGLRHRDVPFRAVDVLENALGLGAAKVRRQDEMRVAKVLAYLGMQKRRATVGERQAVYWFDPESANIKAEFAHLCIP